MTFRFQGLVPAIALLAAGVAHAQSNPTPTQRGPTDVGNMAYPTPSPVGNVTTSTTQAPRDTGNMALPAGTAGPSTVSVTRARRAAAPKPGAMAATATAAGPNAASPTPAGMAAAKGLDTAPGSAPVPYVDFAQSTPMHGKYAMMHGKKPMDVNKVAATKKAAAPAPTPAPAPAPAAK